MDFSFVTDAGPSKKKPEQPGQQRQGSGASASTSRSTIAIPSFHEVQAAQQPASAGFGDLFRPKGLVDALQQQRQGGAGSGHGAPDGGSGDGSKRMRMDVPPQQPGPQPHIPAAMVLHQPQPADRHHQPPQYAHGSGAPHHHSYPPAAGQMPQRQPSLAAPPQQQAGLIGAQQPAAHSTHRATPAAGSRPYGAPPPGGAMGGESSSSASGQGMRQAQVAMPANAILVSNRQRGNPVLKHIRNVKWVHADIGPDYQLGVNTCALFLSLRYHLLHPDYVLYRIKELQRAYALRVLLVHVDVEDAAKPLGDITRAALLNDCTLICAWSPEECARYLETLKAYETKPASSIQERVDTDYVSRLTSVLTGVRGVNKTDALTLSSVLGPLSAILSAQAEELSACPGLGPTKVQRLVDAFHQPFRLLPTPAPPPVHNKPAPAPGPAVTGPAPAVATPAAACAEGLPGRNAHGGQQAAGASAAVAATSIQAHLSPHGAGAGEGDEDDVEEDLVVMATQMMVHAGAAALHADVGREHDDLLGSDADDDDLGAQGLDGGME